jgi:hypothetical protein
MFNTYLLVFVFMLIVLHPTIIKSLNSTSLGRLFLISSIIFSTSQNKMVGFFLTGLTIIVLNQTGPEIFEGYEALQEEEEEEAPVEDNEMIEKKMITPLSSYNIMPIITPELIEPDAFSNVEGFSAF